jgi:hypothetical protein
LKYVADLTFILTWGRFDSISRSSNASKSVEIFWAEIYWGQLFLGSNLVSFNRAVIPYEILTLTTLKLPDNFQMREHSWPCHFILHNFLFNLKYVADLTFILRPFWLGADILLLLVLHINFSSVNGQCF